MTRYPTYPGFVGAVRRGRKYFESHDVLTDLACKLRAHPSVTRSAHRLFRSYAYEEKLEFDVNANGYTTSTRVDRKADGVRYAAFPAPTKIEVQWVCCLSCLLCLSFGGTGPC